MPTCTVNTFKTNQSYKYVYLGEVWAGDKSISVSLWRWTLWNEVFSQLCRKLHVNSTLRKTHPEITGWCSGMVLAHTSLSPHSSHLPAWMTSCVGRRDTDSLLKSLLWGEGFAFAGVVQGMKEIGSLKQAGAPGKVFMLDLKIWESYFCWAGRWGVPQMYCTCRRWRGLMWCLALGHAVVLYLRNVSVPWNWKVPLLSRSLSAARAGGCGSAPLPSPWAQQSYLVEASC